MKKILLLISVLCLLTACTPDTPAQSVAPVAPSVSSSSSEQSSSEAKIYTLEDIAKENKAVVPDMSVPHAIQALNFDSGELGASGKGNVVGGMTIQEIKYHETFDVGSEILKNVVAFDVYSDFNYTKYFLENDAYIEIYDENGKSFSMLNSGYFRDRANDKLYMLFFSDTDDISSYKFAMLGGFLSDKNNGNTRFAYEIAK